MTRTAIERALDSLHTRGRSAHPVIDLPLAILADYLAAHQPEDANDVPRWLERRAAEDLYLACAVAQKDPHAIARFVAIIEPDMRTAIARIVRDMDATQDVLSAVREKLVVGTDARGARIADYAGDGELSVWARVIAIRAALTHLRNAHKHVPGEEELWQAASPDMDPALRTIRTDSAEHIKAAFHAGLAHLEPRQRNLLRQHLLDGLSIDEIGAIYSVHRVTAARWLTAARGDLWAAVKKLLRAKLSLFDASIDAMLDDVRSTLDLSIERALDA